MTSTGSSILSRLPPARHDRSGWPWKGDLCTLGERSQPPEGPIPKISIVTPSYNQGRFIEETIRSVLLQGYPDLELIIIDGGSTDGSVETIRRYEKHLSYWVSEPDRGQSHALNKGFGKATGDVLGWVNSDDYLLPGALRIVGEAFASAPGDMWLSGGCQTVDVDGDTISAFRYQPARDEHCRAAWCNGSTAAWFSDFYEVYQPSSFWSRGLFDKFGPVDETLDYCMDKDLFTSFALGGYSPYIVADVLSAFRLQDQSKSCTSRLPFLREDNLLLKKHWHNLAREDKQYYRRYFAGFVGYLHAMAEHEAAREAAADKNRSTAIDCLLRCARAHGHYAVRESASWVARRAGKLLGWPLWQIAFAADRKVAEARRSRDLGRQQLGLEPQP